MDKIAFTKFDGGIIVSCEGEVLEINDKMVKVAFEGGTYEFRRAPGKSSGYGIGKAKSWRINQDERRKYCFPDLPRSTRR